MSNPKPSPSFDSATGGPSRRPSYGAGTYLCCTSCGRLLRIHWPTRSVICSCGARVATAPTDTPPAK